MTTTTGGAARVLAMMEDYRQTEWPDLEVWLTSTTEQWAVIAVQGPRARERASRRSSTGIDLSPAALPHMAVAEGGVAGVPALLFRVSFTGELGYEINVPASARPRRLGSGLRSPARPHGITPYGTEAMHVLRAEKGYIIVGQDTDGTVTPDDVGLGWAIGRKKPDFVGKRSLDARGDEGADAQAARRACAPRIPRSCSRRARSSSRRPGQATPMKPLGHVTSSYASAALGRSIALAMVAGGRARIGADAVRADAGRRHRGHGDEPRVLRSGRSAAAWLSTRDLDFPAASRRPRGGGPRLRRRAAGGACRASGGRGRAALWLGPDEQLLLAPAGSQARIAAELEIALAGIPHSLVDVSQRQVALAVAGPRHGTCSRAAARSTSIRRRFPSACARGRFSARRRSLLWRPSAEEYHLEVGRSFADYVRGWLREANEGESSCGAVSGRMFGRRYAPSCARRSPWVGIGPRGPGGAAAGGARSGAAARGRALRRDRRHGPAPRAKPAGRRHRGDAARREGAEGPQHHDCHRHREGRPQPQDERVLERAGRVQHPRRLAERLRRPAGAAGRRLPGRQLLELDQPRELPGIRPGARRDAARSAGHAVRPQRDGRRDPVHLAQADRPNSRPTPT